ncbi:MAG: AraC family transcriptional regulator, partial [Lachnospiraceae bacterium]|nr:AraC family transcriptional regulator [Lachnospiraceae bacterium]
MTSDKLAFSIDKGFDYHWSGRFIAPNDNWIHMTRELNDYELVLVTEGSLAIECDGAEYVVNEGEYLIMSPCRQQKGTKNGYCSFYWVHFKAEEAGNVARAVSADAEKNGQDNPETAITLRRQDICAYKERIIILLKELQDADKRYRDRTLNNYLTGALITELSLQGSTDMSFKTTRSKEQLNSDIKTYISWHISESLKIEDIASYFEYNEKYLTTFFKKMNGVPVKQYILKEKTEYAKSILTESNTTVSEVAYSIGFSDVHNFSNAFKKITGMAPG